MLFGKLKGFLFKMKMKEKLFINNMVLSIAPLIIITIFSYRYFVSNTMETMTDFINLFSSQLSSEIQKYVSSVDNISKSLVNDKSALNFLSNERAYSMSDRIMYRRIIDNYIYNMYLQKSDVENIMVIGDSGLAYHSLIIDLDLGLEKIKESEWYRKIHNSDGNLIILPVEPDLGIERVEPIRGVGQAGPDTVDNQGVPVQGDGQFDQGPGNKQPAAASTVIIGRALMDAYGTKHGIILFLTRFDNIISTNVLHNQIITNYDIDIEVRNPKGELIYDTGFDNDGNGTNKVFVVSRKTPEYGLHISIFIPEKNLFSKIHVLRNLTYLFVAGIAVIALLLSIFLSYNITKPLVSLAGSMKLIHKQKYVPIQSGDREDEIGMLTKTYNQMIAKINTLINEVYAAKLKEKQAQFIALQNQINPHMLNNTIENIRMKATLNNDPEVSDMIKMLGKIFNLTLSKKKRNHTIADEIEYVNTYIGLLNMRHDNRFKLTVNIPEKIMRARIIRFAFQPIVENSIIHGFENHTGECRIEIDASFRENDIMITIKDNGTGIDAGRLETVRQMLSQPPDIFEEKSSSIGLKNVYDRIKLEYGENYSLEISSSRQEGTTVVLLIPFMEGDDEDV
jgi:two-component system sensor histidine kinase YesM